MLLYDKGFLITNKVIIYNYFYHYIILIVSLYILFIFCIVIFDYYLKIYNYYFT